VLQESDVPGAVYTALHFSGIRCPQDSTHRDDRCVREILAQSTISRWKLGFNCLPALDGFEHFQYTQQAAEMVRIVLHAEPLEASALELETFNADILEDGPKLRYEFAAAVRSPYLRRSDTSEEHPTNQRLAFDARANDPRRSPLNRGALLYSTPQDEGRQQAGGTTCRSAEEGVSK